MDRLRTFGISGFVRVPSLPPSPEPVLYTEKKRMSEKTPEDSPNFVPPQLQDFAKRRHELINRHQPAHLRDQIKKIAAARKVDPTYVEYVLFPILVSTLAAKAFIEQWEEGPDTRAIRRAASLLEKPGYVTEDDEAVE